MIEFNLLSDISTAEVIVAMMNALYDEDRADFAELDRNKFKHTIEHFVQNPECGSIIQFAEMGKTIGYALLVPYWSNEFGGNIVFVDELFVTEEYRGRGVATKFFSFIEEMRPFKAIACALETSPNNDRARALYRKVGFEARKNTVMVRSFY